MAKELFARGKFRAAEDSFVEIARTSLDPTFRSLQYSNAAQCALKLGNHDRATEHARAALKQNALNPKVYYRLATALSALPLPTTELDAVRRCCDIAMANACAFALYKGHPPALQGRAIVERHEHPVSQEAADLLRCVADGLLAFLRTGIEKVDGGIAVLSPGAKMMLPPGLSLPRHVLGIGNAQLIPCGFMGPHTVFVNENVCFTGWRLKLHGSNQATVCAVGTVALIDCTLSAPDEDGVLVAGQHAHALLSFSTIDDCKCGVEVREGGSLHAMRMKIIDPSRHGISAYGGARQVQLDDCLLEVAGIEGVQCIGPRSPCNLDFSALRSAAGAINLPGDPGQTLESFLRNPVQTAVTNNPADLAQREPNTARLEVSLRDCSILRCGNASGYPIRSGVTVDQGAQVVLRGCELQNCGMAAVFVKGGSDVLVDACRIDFDAQLGVCVDINFDGTVQVNRSVFVGKQGRSIVNRTNNVGADLRAAVRALSGGSAKPIEQSLNRAFTRARNAPSIQVIRNKQVGGSSTRHELEQSGAAHDVTKIPARAGATYRLLGKQFVQTDYPVGNTYGRDVLKGVEVEDGREVRVVLAACGDIRNIFETLATKRGPKRILCA